MHVTDRKIGRRFRREYDWWVEEEISELEPHSGTVFIHIRFRFFLFDLEKLKNLKK
jgi:hypothetical protein